MKRMLILAIMLALPSCKGTPPSQPQPPAVQPLSHIVVQVLGGDGAGKLIELAETGDSLRTDSSCTARFAVPAGHYTVLAFGLNTPGPPPIFLDQVIDTHPGDTTTVIFHNCPMCV